MIGGKLRHRVSVQEKTQTQDPTTGEPLHTWKEVKKVWCEIVPLSAREFMAANATQSKIAGRITMRKNDFIAPDMRIVFRGQAMNVEGVLPDPESGNEYLTIPYSVVVNA